VEIRVKQPLLWVALGLVVFGVVMCLTSHPANLAPVGAIALFGGAILPRKVGWWLPLAVMILSDAIIGFYHGILFTWLGFLLVGLLGMSMRDQTNWFRVPFGAMCGAMIFFIVSNFGVWLQGQLYPHTFAGLVTCYEMALPFFRNTFYGDFLYSWLFFGMYALAMHVVPERKIAE